MNDLEPSILYNKVIMTKASDVLNMYKNLIALALIHKQFIY